MVKTPYKFSLMLPTLSPAATLAVFEDTARGHNELFHGKAIKARDEAHLFDREVKHIGVNEINNTGSEIVIEVFVY